MGNKKNKKNKKSTDTNKATSNQEAKQTLPKTSPQRGGNQQTKQKSPQASAQRGGNQQTKQKSPKCQMSTKHADVVDNASHAISQRGSNQQTKQKSSQSSSPYPSKKPTRQNLTQPTTSRANNKQKIQTSTPNVSFYQNKMPSYPNSDSIEDILTKWPGNYDKLERDCSYIQWLFPNRIPGVNPSAFILTDKEVEIINRSPKLKRKVKRAFEMMLDYYGMRLTIENQFELAENSRERLAALNRRGNPNFKRISRILLAIKELGHTELMRPWMIFLADLIYKEKKLEQAADSFQQFWIETLDAEDKIFLIQYVKQFNL